MDALCPVLGFLGILLLVVMLVGHGLWVLCAWVFRRDRSKGGRRDGVGAGMSLVSTEEQIRVLHRAGYVSDSTLKEVVAALELWRRPELQAKPTGVAERRPVPVVPVGVAAEAAGAEEVEAAFDGAAAQERPSGAANWGLPPERVAEPEKARVPAAPRMPVGEILAAFMEQRNIRWGELIGGLLIVGCSVALVISLWGEIAQRPFLKFSVFTAVTAALFGAGLHTQHRWKLPTTSAGVLLIATLLVPLNFLASAAFSQGAAAGDLLSLTCEAGSAVLFAWLLWMGGRVIAPLWPALVTVGVLGGSVSLLAVRYGMPTAGPGAGVRVTMVGALSVLWCLGSNARMLGVARRWKAFASAESNAVFLLLGVTVFAAVLPVGLLVYRCGQIGQGLHVVAPVVAALGLPALTAGLLIWRRLSGAEAAKARTAGLSVGMAGALVLMAGVAVAWPHARMMVAVAALDAVLLAAVALVMGVPAGHLLAGACLLVAYVLGWGLGTGHVGASPDGRHLVEAALGASTAMALPGLFGIVSAAWGVLRWVGRKEDSRFVALVAGGVATTSAALVTWWAYGSATGLPASAAVYGLYAAAALVAARIGGRRWMGAAGWAVLLLGLQQAFEWVGARDAWVLALLTEASVAAVVRAVAERVGFDVRRLWGDPATWAAFASSVVGAVLLVTDVRLGVGGRIAAEFTWLGGVWLVLSVARGSKVVFSASQVALTLAAVLEALARFGGHALFGSTTYPLAIETMALAAAACSLVWALLRPLVGVVEKRLACADALMPEKWAVERVLAWAAVVALLALACVAVVPGIARELAAAAVPGAAGNGPWLAASGYAAGQGSWALLGVLVAVMVVELRNRASAAWALGMVVVLGAGCGLVAGRWGADAASASALRWACAAYLVLGSMVIWLRGYVGTACGRVLRLGSDELERLTCAEMCRDLLLVMTVLPILALTVVPATMAMQHEPVAGPVVGSVFARMGDAASYVAPLAAVVLVLVGYSISEWSAGFAFSAGLVLNLTVTLAYVLSVLPSPLGWVERLQLVQWNALAAGGFALAWVAIRVPLNWMRGRASATPTLLSVQVIVALLVNAVPIGLGELRVWAGPWAPTLPAEMGSALGWAALLTALAAGAGCWEAWVGGRRGRQIYAGIAVLLVAPMCAFAARQLGWGSWESHHTLLAAYGLGAWGMLGAAWTLYRGEGGTVRGLAGAGVGAPEQAAGGVPVLSYQQPGLPRELDELGEEKGFVRWAMALGWVVAVIALRESLDDPQAPWWSVGGMLAAMLLAVAIACWRTARGYLYAAGLLFNLAATIWWMHQGAAWSGGRGTGLLNVNLIALAVPALAWLVLELQVFGRTASAKSKWMPFHRVVAAGAMALLAVEVAIGLASDASGVASRSVVWLEWGALGSVGALIVACLWDRGARAALPQLYLLGLVAAGVTVDQYDLAGRELAWLGTIVLGAYAVVSGYLFSIRKHLGALGQQLGVPQRDGEQAAKWLLPANAVLGVVVAVGGLCGDFAFQQLPMRLMSGGAAMAQAVALGLLAQGRRRSPLQQAALWAVVVGAVICGWAMLRPDVPVMALHRLVVLMSVLAGASVVYGVGLGKLLHGGNDWIHAAQRVLPLLASLTVASLLVVLGGEISSRVTAHAVPMHGLAIVAVAMALLGTVVGSLVLAIVPGRDPLALPERGRTIYVYAAEVLLALLFVHIRLTMPYLFHGFLMRYWPLVVMGLAFLGVGMSELFRRQGRMVLAEPLERTGALLPILPALAYWMLTPQVDYSIVLVVVGLLYTGLAVMRRSFGFGLLAALAANGALWHLLYTMQGYGLLEHPQIWCIPAALCVLAAAHLNRRELSEQQLQAVRYACLMLIYVSSTADIFLNGVKEAPWLPVVLAGLSVVGVLAGIALRVRSFLFLGTGFLLLALGAIIYHAAVDLRQTWLIWVCGIVLGGAILTLFALFEKKRSEMLALVEDLREWRG